jgi:hypothetical protein
MTKPTKDFYVQFVWLCECGSELQVHGEHYVGFREALSLSRAPSVAKNIAYPLEHSSSLSVKVRCGIA